MFIAKEQFAQHDKEIFIANRIIKRLLFENCTQAECYNILKILEQKILGKSIYENLESSEIR